MLLAFYWLTGQWTSMSDLFDQVRILAVMYLASYDRDPTKPPMSYRVLASEEYLKFMEDVGRLSPMATDLHISEYIAGDNYLLYLTKKGVETIKALFRKFLAFIKKNYPVTLSTWINNLELNKNTVHTLIRDSYFYIEKEPLMQEAFKHYLNEIETIENVDTFKVDIYDSSRLI